MTEAAGESDNLLVPTLTYGEIVKDDIVPPCIENRTLGYAPPRYSRRRTQPETTAQEYCRKLGIDTIIQEAVKVLGEVGYLRRNELMLRYNQPDIVVGFALSFKEITVVSDTMKKAEWKEITIKPMTMSV